MGRTTSWSSAAAPAGWNWSPGLATSWASGGRRRVSLVERSRTHLWKPLLHEIAAGSMDLEKHADRLSRPVPLAQFPLPLRRDDRARPGEPHGPCGATYDEDEGLITPRAQLHLRHARHRRSAATPTTSARRARGNTPSRWTRRRRPTRFHRRLVNACLRAHAQTDAGAARAAARGDHRRRRDGGGTGGRAAPHHRGPSSPTAWTRIDPERDITHHA